MALSWRTYTAPDPFEVAGDYLRPYYAIYFEEIMHNVNRAEELSDMALTTWYRYTSPTDRQAFIPLENGVEQLGGYYPRCAGYVLQIREALEDLWTEWGNSRAEVLQTRFGYADWLHPGGFDAARQEFADRDIEELRFSLPHVYVGLGWSLANKYGHGSGKVEMPEGYEEAEEEEQAAMEAAGVNAAWAEARAEAWENYQDYGPYWWPIGSRYLTMFRRWNGWAGMLAGKAQANAHVYTRAFAFTIVATPYPSHAGGFQVTGSLTFHVRRVASSESSSLYGRSYQYDHQPTPAEIEVKMRQGLTLLEADLGTEWTEVVVPFVLTTEEPAVLLVLGAGSPAAYDNNPLPTSCDEDGVSYWGHDVDLGTYEPGWPGGIYHLDYSLF